jgi:DNA-binding beta-propeller fold protein YncE
VCSPAACPAVLEFAPGSGAGSSPSAIIEGTNTLLVAPTDVKVDSSGNIYVADTAAGAGVIYVFSAGSNGNVAPVETIKSPGSLSGIGLVPNNGLVP